MYTYFSDLGDLLNSFLSNCWKASFQRTMIEKYCDYFQKVSLALEII